MYLFVVDRELLGSNGGREREENFRIETDRSDFTFDNSQNDIRICFLKNSLAGSSLEKFSLDEHYENHNK